MVVGLYSALATTAGVFVGLLSAYLVSRIVGLKAERRRIEKRVASINARLDALKQHHEWRDEQLSEMDRRNAEQDANDVVDRFIRQCVGEDWDPDPNDTDLDEAIQALVDYHFVDPDDLSDFHVEAVSERLDEIIEELRPNPRGPFGYPSPLENIDPEILASDSQTMSLWDIHRDSIYERRVSDFAKIDTEIDSLTKERERLVSYYEESDPTVLMDVLRSTVWIIILSVFIPLLVYLLNAIDLLYPAPFGTTIEPVIVFLSWCTGLALTYRYIENDVLTSEGSLPDSSMDGGESDETDTTEAKNAGDLNSDPTTNTEEIENWET